MQTNNIAVSNMTSPQGNKVANQFIITEKGGIMGNFVRRETFQSYDSIIAVRTIWGDDNGNKIDIQLDSYYWDYSATTSKYRSQFLGESTQETKDKIDSGEYKTVNLN